MHDHFGVAVGLEDRAAMLEFAAPLGGIGEIAVVAEGDFALVAIDHDGLRVEKSFIAGGRIARVADRKVSRQLSEHAGLKDFFDVAHGAMQEEICAVARNDACGFLAAMLKRIKAQIGEIGGFGMAEYAEHTTLVVKMIVGKSELVCHFAANVFSSELAQTLRRVSRGESTTALPLYSMRSALPRCTLPISRAPTLYCLAVARTAASFVGETETIQRAPRSLKRACSAGPSTSSFTFAPKTGMACSAPTGDAEKQDSARVTAMPPSEMSWADWSEPSDARAMRQSIRRFSAARSMAGGSPETTPAMVLEYSDEENSHAPSKACSSCRGAACRARSDEATAFEPSSNRMRSPSERNAI